MDSFKSKYDFWLLYCKDYLNKQKFIFYAILFFVFYSASAIPEIARYEWNPTVLFRFGHYYIQQNEDMTPEGVIRFTGNESNGGNGYDGQIFYYFARSLSLPGVWPRGFSMAYRAPRVGLPLINFIFGYFGNNILAGGFIVLQFGLILCSTFFLFRILSENSRYLLLFYVLSPFLLRSTQLMVSDGTMVSMAVIGYYFFSRDRPNIVFTFIAWLLFSISLLSKESALFLLFPLGLYSLYKKDLTKIFLVAATLLPMLAWQYYLRTTHGMIPANILKIFISPFNGIAGVLTETIKIFDQSGSAKTIIILQLKNLAKILLIVILGSAIYATLAGSWKNNWHFRLMSLFTIISIVFADYFYFWGIFDNVARMFGALIPAIILLKNSNPGSRTFLFFLSTMVLGLMVLLRAMFLTPVFPHDTWKKYTGPNHLTDPVRPLFYKSIKNYQPVFKP